MIFMFSGSNTLTAAQTPSAPQTLLRYILPAATEGTLGYVIGGSLYFGSDASFVTGHGGKSTINAVDGDAVSPGTASMLSGVAGIRMGIHRTLDVLLDIPFYTDITGWETAKRTTGDISLGVLFVPSPPERALRIGMRLSAIVPNGHQENSLLPRHVYYIERDSANIHNNGVTFAQNKFYLQPTFTISFDIKKQVDLPLEIHLNTGSVISDAKERFTLDGGLALVLRPTTSLALSIEFTSEMRPFVPNRKALEGFLTDPLRLVPAASIDLPGGISLQVNGEFGLSRNSDSFRSTWNRGGYIYGTKAMPTVGMGVSLIIRGTVLALFPKPIGPEWPGDRDRDSIPDSLDRCPKTPEDRDGFLDEDGCLDSDNDKDGINDLLDKCPNDAEDFDRFEDKDGCPDADNDGDGIADNDDACPNETGLDNNHGCPLTGDLTFIRTILDNISFKPGSAKLASGSEKLDRIYTAMHKTPGATIEFQVHTDNIGSSDSSSILSQKRADMLKLYLVAKGISPDRIKAIGMGSEFPITDNSTEEGRAKNRRVEVRRIK